MKVTQVSIIPTEASKNAGRPSLTPELLAATGARYSRNNEGLENILNKIDINNPDKSVDTIFKYTDFGHQSILDNIPVSMFMDDISVFLAYFLWSVCPTASGQESSTRYVKMTKDGLVDPELLGINKEEHQEWYKNMNDAVMAYEDQLKFWTKYGEEHPELMRIPKTLMEDTSEKAKKQVDRMKRNYAFDRSRYYIPVAMKTNVMMVMSARSWVSLCVQLLSHPIPEFQLLGDKIKSELELVSPRSIKHAVPHEAMIETHKANLGNAQCYIGSVSTDQASDYQSDGAYLQIHKQSGQVPIDCNEDGDLDVSFDLKKRTNRYSSVGPYLSNQFVTFGWDNVSIAEIRDFNRHRTGKKSCILCPGGFYKADDQLLEADKYLAKKNFVETKTTNIALEKLGAGDASYIYWTLLGHQYPFEHTTSADHFIYEAELRTGVGSHYKYAEHLRNVLQLWYAEYPETSPYERKRIAEDLGVEVDLSGTIFEGSAEPE